VPFFIITNFFSDLFLVLAIKKTKIFDKNEINDKMKGILEQSSYVCGK
jgi:hypothetical protein